jgi:hypothetical protein
MTGVELFLLINAGMLGALLWRVYTLELVIIGVLDGEDLE